MLFLTFFVLAVLDKRHTEVDLHGIYFVSEFNVVWMFLALMTVFNGMAHWFSDKRSTTLIVAKTQFTIYLLGLLLVLGADVFHLYPSYQVLISPSTYDLWSMVLFNPAVIGVIILLLSLVFSVFLLIQILIGGIRCC